MKNLIKKLSLIKKTTWLLIIFAFFGINFLLSFLTIRLDFSKGKTYSLSSSTKKIIKNLDKKTTITFYVSSDLPSKMITLKNDVVDLLKEYQRVNQGKIDLKIIDPKLNDKELNLVKQSGIPELQFSQLEKDKYAISSVYFGLLINYQDKSEIIPQLTEVESLEYNLTSLIYKLTNKDLPKINIIGKKPQYNSQSMELISEINYLSQTFEKQYEVSYLDSIDDGYKTTLIFDDRSKNYTDEEIDQIKTYLDKKNKIIFFVDGVWVDDMMMPNVANHGLNKLFKQYGITIKDNLVLSTNAEIVNFGNSMVSYLFPYPFWIKTNNFSSDKDTNLFNINQLTFIWPSSIEYKKTNDVNIKELVFSTNNSWLQSSGSGYILDPQSIPQPNIKDLKKHLLVADILIKDKGEFMIISSSRFVEDKYLSQTSGNLQFVTNIVNHYASGGALSGISSRQVVFYSLPELSSTEKDIYKYLSIFLLPGLFIIYGIFRILKKQ